MDLIIDEISQAAYEAIEQAAIEATRAAMLASVEREAVLLREAQQWRMEAEALKNNRKHNEIFIGVIGFLSGLLVGGITVYAIGGR